MVLEPILPLALFLISYHSFLSSFFCNFTFFIPIFLELFLIFSTFFFTAPNNSIEVFNGFNPCSAILFSNFFSLFFQIQFIVIFFLFLLSMMALFYLLYYYTLISILLVFFECYILHTEQYFSLIVDMINTALEFISVWKKVPLCSLLFYLPLTAGYRMILVTIKIFITVSMMIGNIIDIYLSGIQVVLINWLLYSRYFGWILCSYLLYLFLTRIELCPIISFILEPFSIMSQSLTLSNRLSINIPAGSLLINPLSIAVIVFSNYLSIIGLWILIIHLVIIYSFEILNSLIQLFTFNLLSIEYLSSTL